MYISSYKNYWERVFISLYGYEQVMRLQGINIKTIEKNEDKYKEEKGDKK